MPALKRFRRKTVLLVRFALILVLIAVVSRNVVSRKVGEHLASSVLGTRVRIDRVSIGWGNVHVRGLTVLDPAFHGETQLEVQRIRIIASILEGIRSGVWLESIDISRPTLHARFDENGALLSRFPKFEKSSGGSSTIPLESLLVAGARVVVHQGQQRCVIIDQADLLANFDTSIHIRGRIEHVLEGTLLFETNVDATTLQGSSIVRIANCRLDSQKVPGSLLPQGVRAEQFSGIASVNASIQHPAGVTDPRLHPASLRAELREITWSEFGTVVDRLSLNARNNEDGVTLQLDSNLLDGKARVQLSATSLVAPLNATISSEVSGCRLDPLIEILASGFDVHATGDLVTSATIGWDGQNATFSGSAQATARGLSAVQIDVDDVICDIQFDGKSVVKDALDGLSGRVTGSISTEGLSLDQLSDRVPVVAWKGRLGATASFELPLESLLDPNALTASAVVDFDEVGDQHVMLQDSIITCSLEHGIATIDFPETNILGSEGDVVATMAGRAQAGWPSQQLAIDAELREISPRQIAMLQGSSGERIDGHLHAQITARSMLDALVRPEAWDVTGILRTDKLLLAGETIDDVQIQCDLSEGVLTIPPTKMKWRENACQLALTGVVDQDLTIDSRFEAGPIRLSDVADVASKLSKTALPLRGTASIEGSLRIDTKAATFHSKGSSRLTEAVYGQTKIGSADLLWNADRSGVTFETQSENFLGGSYAFTAIANELDWTRATIDMRFKDLDANRIPQLLRLALPVTGTFEGGCRLTSLSALDELQGEAWLRSHGVSVQKIPIEISDARIAIQDGTTRASARGKLLRGTFAANASGNLEELVMFAQNEQPDLRLLPLSIKATLNGLSIDNAIQMGRFPASLRPLAGMVSATCIRDETANRDGLFCTVTASTDNVRWHQARLTDRITATVHVRPDRIELASIDGRFADGRLSGRGLVSLEGEPRGFFQFGANRVNLRLAAAPLGRSLSGVSGTGSIQVDGRIGRTITGRADVTASHPSMSDLNIRAVRLPIDWSFTPTTRQLSWRCRAGMVEAGDGKINVSTEGTFTRSLDMRLSAQLNHIDTARITRSGSVNAGTLDGQVYLQAKRARTLQQITGNFDLTMSKVDSLKMPVLDQLNTVVSLKPSIGSNQSNDGVIHGRIAGGLVHLDQLAITQSNVQVLVRGSATLDGRLDFDLTAATGQAGPAEGIAELANSPLMLAAPAPVTLVLKANQAMKDRVVHVHVGGTASRPTLRLQPGKQLTQDTLRFFLTNSFGSQIANAADASRRPYPLQ